MNQYTVLLVDDEEEVFQVIMKKLDWESMGFSIAGYARNGVEALEMAEELQPDVVMTDIKMPYMDGLTLCKKLKELYQKVKVIIFSGFDEFEYAKEAIKIEAEEYILKPINSNELREVFERIKVNLDKELDEKRNIDKLREYYMESLPVLQENFYTSLIEGRIPESQIERYVQNYQINLTGPYYVVTVLHISTTNPENVPIDPFLLTVSVKKLAEEQLTEKWNCRTVTYLGDILVIAQLSDVDSVTHFTDDMDRFCKMAKRVCKATVTAGIGHVCNQLSQLSLSYHGAKNATSYRVLYGNTRAINIAEMDPQESVDEHWEEAYIEKILKKVKMGEQEPLEEAIAEFTGQMAKTRMSLQNYRILVMELIAEIFRLISGKQLGVENLYQVFQKPFRMERKFFVIRDFSRIASVYIFFLKSFEIGVRCVIFFYFVIGFVFILIVFDQPEISVMSLVEHDFERKRKRAALLVPVPYIVRTCIGKYTGHVAFTSGDVPGRTAFHFAENRRSSG